MGRDERATIAAYQQDAVAYRDGTLVRSQARLARLDRFAARLMTSASVLEIGSGPGHDATELEARGLSVRRTDITPAFVELIRGGGYEADLLDPLVDDLGGPYAGVWAEAVLLHLERSDTPTVLARLARATAGNGLLHLSMKEGDGEGWSTHGSVRAPRRFTYWRAEPLREVVEATGWQVELLDSRAGTGGPWLDVLAHRSSP